MLFKAAILEEIAAGRVDRAFRLWRKPSVKSGGSLQTSAGVLGIDAVTAITTDDLTVEDAERSGHPSYDAMLRALTAVDDRQLYRIDFHIAGDDPRVALRQTIELSVEDIASISQSLARFDRSSRNGAWTDTVLTLIGSLDGRTASDIVQRTRINKPLLKTRIRQLKALGLTESLSSGYRLSPRGRRYMEKRAPLPNLAGE